jgi:small-conductance mechanosensitive channel
LTPEVTEILKRWNWLHFAENNPFLATGLSVIVMLGLSFLVYQIVFWVLRKRMQKADFLLPSLIRKQTHTPGLFTFFAFGLVLVMPFLPIPSLWQGLINKGLGIFQIICVAWLLISIIQALREFVVGKYVASAGGNNHRIRTVYTQYKIFERILIFIIIVMGIIAILMTFDGVRQIGVSLLASAGVLGVIVGFAAQKSLAGVLAGIQIAISQPIRIDDVVVVEGDWGRVEEITLTYVIICLWDDRRLVVPIAYFIEKPFYNWTRSNDAISGAVVLQVDLTTNVEAIRAYYLAEIAKNKLWDGRNARVQVVDVQDRILHVRFVCSASNSDALFDLRCVLREQLLAYLATHQPESLPRNRVESIAGSLPNSQENNYQPQ